MLCKSKGLQSAEFYLPSTTNAEVTSSLESADFTTLSII